MCFCCRIMLPSGGWVWASKSFKNSSHPTLNSSIVLHSLVTFSYLQYTHLCHPMSLAFQKGHNITSALTCFAWYIIPSSLYSENFLTPSSLSLSLFLFVSRCLCHPSFNKTCLLFDSASSLLAKPHLPPHPQHTSVDITLQPFLITHNIFGFSSFSQTLFCFMHWIVLLLVSKPSKSGYSSLHSHWHSYSLGFEMSKNTA